MGVAKSRGMKADRGGERNQGMANWRSWETGVGGVNTAEKMAQMRLSWRSRATTVGGWNLFRGSGNGLRRAQSAPGHARPQRLKSRIAHGCGPLGIRGDRNEEGRAFGVGFLEPGVCGVLIVKSKFDDRNKVGVDEPAA